MTHPAFNTPLTQCHHCLPVAYLCMSPHMKHWEASSRDKLPRAVPGPWIIQMSTARHAGRTLLRTRRECSTHSQHKHVLHSCKTSAHTQKAHINIAYCTHARTLYVDGARAAYMCVYDIRLKSPICLHHPTFRVHHQHTLIISRKLFLCIRLIGCCRGAFLWSRPWKHRTTVYQ